MNVRRHALSCLLAGPALLLVGCTGVPKEAPPSVVQVVEPRAAVETAPARPVAAPAAVQPALVQARTAPPVDASGRLVTGEIIATPVVFNFNRFEPDQMQPEARAQIDRLMARIERLRDVEVTEVRLWGHADRLNSTGNADYNRQLSARRVETVRRLLTDKGLNPALIRVTPAGDRQPVAACDGHFASRAALQECLLPNRRVEVQVVTAVRPGFDTRTTALVGR